MSQEKRTELLDRCAGIRVTDWRDALDAIGLFDRGLMRPEIQPLWHDVDTLDHCVVGWAFTLRYVPTGRTIKAQSVEDFHRQEGQWYGQQPNWAAQLEEGDLIVIDGAGTPTTGYVGSMNSLTWLRRGAVGIVTNSGVRDTDELRIQKIPVYCTGLSRGIIPGRAELDGYGQPVECGGVEVHPDDLVVADGDGVIVIPSDSVEAALPVAEEIQSSDQRARARLYRELGLEPDATLGEAAQLVEGEGAE